MSTPASIAQSVVEEEWNFVAQIKSCEHQFIFLSRKATIPQTISAERIHPVEFFLKP